MRTREFMTSDDLEYFQELMALRLESPDANKDELAACYRLIALINDILEDYQP